MAQRPVSNESRVVSLTTTSPLPNPFLGLYFIYSTSPLSSISISFYHLQSPLLPLSPLSVLSKHVHSLIPLIKAGSGSKARHLSNQTHLLMRSSVAGGGCLCVIVCRESCPDGKKANDGEKKKKKT